MYVATWKEQVIAQSNETVEIEGNQYFPKSSVNMELLRESDLTSNCPWKGQANYFDIVVDSEVNKDAVWTYLQPKDAAKEIAGYLAFWRGVEVTKN